MPLIKISISAFTLWVVPYSLLKKNLLLERCTLMVESGLINPFNTIMGCTASPLNFISFSQDMIVTNTAISTSIIGYFFTICILILLFCLPFIIITDRRYDRENRDLYKFFALLHVAKRRIPIPVLFSHD